MACAEPSFCFLVQRVTSFPRAILIEFQSLRGVLLVLRGSIRPLLALGASELDYDPWLTLLCHLTCFFFHGPRRPRSFYSITLVMTPAPTVLPPSRMAKRMPCSRATGEIKSM